MSSDNKQSITPTSDGPYIVKELVNFANQNGAIECKETMALCRCGQSANKPYCDGTHAKVEFTSSNPERSISDRQDRYAGKQITIFDNRSICAHAGYCTDGLESVFRMKKEPWIDPDSASVDEIIAVIEKCPSGALSYSIDDVAQNNQGGGDSAAIFIAPNGPYVISGNVGLNDSEFAQGASKTRLTLCRCGNSKNKPFCDGSHWESHFSDDKN